MADNYITVTLDGTEQEVYTGGCNCDIRNDGTDTVYLSPEAGVVPDAKGVLSVPAGQAAKYIGLHGRAHLLGTGKVILCGNNYADQVFKVAATSSGGGGADEVARNAINALTPEVAANSAAIDAINDADTGLLAQARLLVQIVPMDSALVVQVPVFDGANRYRIQIFRNEQWETVYWDTAPVYCMTGLTNGTTYLFRVFAYNADEQLYTYPVAAGTPVATPFKVTAENLVATAGDGKVTLTWDALFGATKFRVRRDDGNGWADLADIEPNKYIDTAVANGTTYRYCVYAFIGGAWQSPTGTVSATPAV